MRNGAVHRCPFRVVGRGEILWRAAQPERISKSNTAGLRNDPILSPCLKGSCQAVAIHTDFLSYQGEIALRFGQLLQHVLFMLLQQL